MGVRPTAGSTTSPGSHGLGAYQDAMRTQRMERDAARLAQALRADGAQATVRTRSIGITLGSLGIDLTTHDVEMPEATAPTLAGRAFSDALDAAALLAETAAGQQAAGASGAAGSEALSADAVLSRRRALEAYAQAALAQFQPVPGRLGSV
jgi:hypothetical protein